MNKLLNRKMDIFLKHFKWPFIVSNSKKKKDKSTALEANKNIDLKEFSDVVKFLNLIQLPLVCVYVRVRVFIFR